MKTLLKTNIIEKLQIILFGLALPAYIIFRTLDLLIIDEAAVFLSISGFIEYYDFHAYLVSCFWFGISLLLFSYFFLQLLFVVMDTFILRAIGLLLTMVGLISAFWIAILA